MCDQLARSIGGRVAAQRTCGSLPSDTTIVRLTLRPPTAATSPSKTTAAASAPPAPTTAPSLDQDARRRAVDGALGATLQATREQPASTRTKGGVLAFRLGRGALSRGAERPHRIRDAIKDLFTGGAGNRGVSAAVGGAMMLSVALGATGCASGPQPEHAPAPSSTSVVQVDRSDAPSPAERAAAAQQAAAAQRQAQQLKNAHGKVDGLSKELLGHALPRGHDVHQLATHLVEQGHPEQVGPRARTALQKIHHQQVQQTIASWQRTPPPSDHSRVSRDGETLDRRTAVLVDRAELIMREQLGHEGFRFSVVQGSYSTAVAASGGTHDGGGALDVHTASYSQETVDDMVKAMRKAGFAAWSRGRGFDSFDPHIHAIGIGDAQASYGAKAQVQMYFNGQNGLADYGRDPDARLGRSAPQWAQRFNA